MIIRLLVFFFLAFVSGCNDYSSGEKVNVVPGLKIEGLLMPKSDFSYYREKSTRGEVVLLYFSNNEFYDLNKEHVLWEVEDIIIDPKGGRNFISNFERSSLSPEFNFDLKYGYFKIDPRKTNVRVDGLYNEEHNIHVVRVLNWSNDA